MTADQQQEPAQLFASDQGPERADTVVATRGDGSNGDQKDETKPDGSRSTPPADETAQ